MIEQSRVPNYRNKQITEDKVMHRMIVSPDVQKIEERLKKQNQSKRKVKKNGKLRNSSKR